MIPTDLPASWWDACVLLISLNLFLYAEIHYRFPWFPFSRYYRREPEILVDIPRRVEPSAKLPLVLLIKDAGRFPITLDSLEIILEDSQGIKRRELREYKLIISAPWFTDLVAIDVAGLHDRIQVHAYIKYIIKDSMKLAVNHNIRTSPTKAFYIRKSGFPIPGSREFWWGDLHHHSAYTADVVEYGAPPAVTQTVATAMGLDFLALTDHSYDLDDKPDSWSENDPALSKWHQSREEIRRLNRSGAAVLIPGEEVTCRNSQDRNVHLLVLNHPDFIPGTGDSTDRIFDTGSELSIVEVLEGLAPPALALAAHPFTSAPFLERLLLRRGNWGLTDTCNPHLTGLQIINGSYIAGQIERWVQLLLTGRKKTLCAGNDAHGNFHWFHQIRLPMISTHVHSRQVLGQWRTGIEKAGELNIPNIIAGLRRGRCVVSNGPMAGMKIRTSEQVYRLGDTVSADSYVVLLTCQSSPEYGPLHKLEVYQGIFGEIQESRIYFKTWDEEQFECEISFPGTWSSGPGYLRCVLTVPGDGLCLTNPIWIDPGIPG